MNTENPPAELVLVRHGETDWNVEGRIQGHLDIPLNETGLAQAAAVGNRLREEAFDRIYASDLMRAWRTATPATHGDDQRIQREQRLRERHLGVLQGLTSDEAASRAPEAWAAFRTRQPDMPLQGGESLGEFSRRVVGLMTELAQRHAGSRILLVTHGGVLDVAYRHATNMPLDTPRDFPIFNASVNVLQHRLGAWSVISWGDVSHLPQELALDDT
jgi:2,3-bisphosphoglycerate-dependent phosphoglycerate mutase